MEGWPLVPSTRGFFLTGKVNSGTVPTTRENNAFQKSKPCNPGIHPLQPDGAIYAIYLRNQLFLGRGFMNSTLTRLYLSSLPGNYIPRGMIKADTWKLH